MFDMSGIKILAKDECEGKSREKMHSHTHYILTNKKHKISRIKRSWTGGEASIALFYIVDDVKFSWNTKVCGGVIRD